MCVRLIQMGGVDLATFQFDPFLSWSVFFMNGDKTIYGRYGTAHPATKRDRADSNPNPTLAGLRAAATRALEIHESYVEAPESVGPALAGKTGPEPRWRFAEKTPAARKYKRLKRVDGGDEGCVHCHEVQRVAIDSHFMKRLDIPDSMLWMYPRPHVLGLAFDIDHCARISSVTPDSIAAAAGLSKGDDLVSLAGQPLVSVADVQWILHNVADDGGELACEVRRGDERLALTLKLPPHWRRAEDWVWRFRVAGYASWLWAGVSFADHADGVRVAQHAPRWFKRENGDGMRALRRGDVIVEIDGRAGMDRSALLAYLMREKPLGSTVRMTVLRGGGRTKVSFKIPKEQPEVQGY